MTLPQPTIKATPLEVLRAPVDDQAIQDAVAVRVLRGELDKEQAVDEVVRLLEESEWENSTTSSVESGGNR